MACIMPSMELALPFQSSSIGFNQSNSNKFTSHKRIHMPLFHLYTHLSISASVTAAKVQPTVNFPCEKDLLNDFNTYASLLQACTNIKQLCQFHTHMLKTGLDQNIKLLTKLVNMYAIFGSMDDARLLFDKTDRPNVFLWTAMIRGYVSNGFCEEAVKLYRQIQMSGIQPDKFVFTSVIKACTVLSSLQEGMEIHGDIVRTGFEYDIIVGNSLLAMYAKCGAIEIARQIFDKMPARDVVSWSTMISGSVQNGRANEALILFNEMQLQGIKSDSVTITSLLPACAHLLALQQGKRIHGYILRNGFESDVIVGTALIDMYAKCGSIDSARRVFDTMSTRNVFSWSAMIACYAQSGYASETFTLFHQMQLQGIKPNSVTMVSLLRACFRLTLQHGKWVHGYTIRSGFDSDVVVGTALVDMYANCGSLDMARRIFDKMSKSKRDYVAETSNSKDENSLQETGEDKH